MKFLACHLLLFFIYSVSGDITLKDCGKSKVPLERIEGGEEAQPGQFPWMVAVYEKLDNNFDLIVCGGAILNEYWIVTAAHCFHYPDDPGRYNLIAGGHKLYKETTGSLQQIKLSKITVHQMYKSDSFTHDIALVKSISRINVNSMYINGICLPDCATNPSGNATVIGWGFTKPDEVVKDILKQVEIPIIDWKYCKDAYGSEFSEYQYLQEEPTLLCAGKEGGKSPCEIDSGGPLFQYNKDGAAVLIGIVAFGDCDYKNSPGMYIKISAFMSWMERVMELNPNEDAKCPVHK